MDANANDYDERAVALFRGYLRVKTVHPKPDYDGARAFIERTAQLLKLPAPRTVQLSSGREVILITVPGAEPELGAVLLNSHTDVVPVEAGKWEHDPWAADEDAEGRIWARGTQDMKCCAIQHMEAVARLIARGAPLRRTIHFSFVPDEEIGGQTGMKLFVETPEFAALNVAVALDEGLADPGPVHVVYYAERAPWWVRLIATGNVGHGSRFIPGTAVAQLHEAVGRLFQFRDSERARVEEGGEDLGDVTTVNVTSMAAGDPAQPNVIPSTATATVDIRIAPSVDLVEFEKKLRDMTPGLKLEFVIKTPEHGVSGMEGPFWEAVRGAVVGDGIDIAPRVFPAATDSRFIRRRGIPAFGFTPMPNTPVLLHDHNEFLSRKVFLDGVRVMERVVEAVVNAK